MHTEIDEVLNHIFLKLCDKGWFDKTEYLGGWVMRNVFNSLRETTDLDLNLKNGDWETFVTDVDIILSELELVSGIKIREPKFDENGNCTTCLGIKFKINNIKMGLDVNIVPNIESPTCTILDREVSAYTAEMIIVEKLVAFSKTRLRRVKDIYDINFLISTQRINGDSLEKQLVLLNDEALIGLKNLFDLLQDEDFLQQLLEVYSKLNLSRLSGWFVKRENTNKKNISDK